jgi:hypothetical protein
MDRDELGNRCRDPEPEPETMVVVVVVDNVWSAILVELELDENEGRLTRSGERWSSNPLILST